jgi:hypothetical protein
VKAFDDFWWICRFYAPTRFLTDEQTAPREEAAFCSLLQMTEGCKAVEKLQANYKGGNRFSAAQSV